MLRKLQNTTYEVLSGLPLRPSLRILSGGCGLLGDVFMALNGLRFAELNGYAAEVLWDSRSLYFDQGIGTNAWSYFFEDSTFDFSGGAQRLNLSVPYRPGAEVFAPYAGLSIRSSVWKALSRFCRPGTGLSNEVDAFVARNFSSSSTLGVHIRLTDASNGSEGRTSTSIGIEDFSKATEAWLAKKPSSSRIFLATDDMRALEQFQTRFGDLVVFQECLRSRDGTSIHGHYDGGVKGSPYTKGKEAMIDALLLSRCNYLIRSHSRLTCYSLCMNPSLRYTDLTKTILGADHMPWLQDGQE